jgi:hypothetical protein
MPGQEQTTSIDALRAIGDEAMTLLERAEHTDPRQVAQLRADLQAADEVETMRLAVTAVIDALNATDEHNKAVSTFNERLARVEAEIAGDDEAKPDAY